MRFSVLPPSYSLVAIVMSRSRACFLSSTTVIFTTASEPSSFRVTRHLLHDSRGEGVASAPAAAGDSRASARTANRCFVMGFLLSK